VAEELLDGADVVSILEQMRGEGVPEHMAAGVFPDVGGATGSVTARSTTDSSRW
jgi:hypothetical protein